MADCGTVQIMFFGPAVVFGDDTTGTSHVISASFPTAKVRQVRVSLQVLALTRNASVQRGYQLSNDQLSWYDDASTPTLDAVTLLGQAQTTVTTDYGTTFTTVPQNAAAARLWIRFVVLCSNRSETALVNASVGGRIETKALS